MVVVDTFPLSKTITLVFSWMLFEWDFWKCVVVTCSKLYLCSYQFLVTLNHFQGHMRIWKIKDKKRQVGMFYPLRMSLNSCSCFSVVWNTIWLWIITQTWKMVLCSVESSVFRISVDDETSCGSGIFRAFEDLEGRFLMYQSPSALFFLIEISSCTRIPLFKPGSVHSGSAS